MNLNLPAWLSGAFASKKPVEPKIGEELAWSDSSLYSGADFPKYNPDDLMSRKGFAVYKRMMNDEQVKAVVRFKRDAITSRDYVFEMDATDTLSEEEAQFRIDLSYALVDAIKGSLTDALNGIMSSMYNGFSVTEKVLGQFEYDGRTWYGVDFLKLRPADSFVFHTDKHGNTKKVEQLLGVEAQDIDIARFIHFVHNPDVDPHYGRSELREAYRAWFSKDMVIKFQNIHLERFAAGFVYATPKNGKTLTEGSREFEALKQVMARIQATSSMILPADVDLTVVHPASTDAFERAISQHDKAIAKALLVPNLLGISEQGSTGSYSQSQTQLEAFLWTLDADATRLEEALNNQLFAELAQYNFGDNNWPRFKFKPVSDARKMEIIKTWQALVTAGAVQATEADEAHVRDLMEMPQKPKLDKPTESLVLNGAQLQSLTSIIQSVSDGTVPPAAAKELILAAFPLSVEQVDRMVDGAVKEVEEPPAQATDNNEPPVHGEGAVGGEPAPEPKLDAEGKPIVEETVLGTGTVSVSAFTTAIKRVDFAVINNRTESNALSAKDRIAVFNGEVIARMLADAEELKLGTADGNPDDVQSIVYTVKELSQLKSLFSDALKESWNIGTDHARREVAKAKKGASFAVNDKALQDVAAQYLKQRAYTMVGDLSNATQKTIRNILLEGIKVSKTAEETKKAIYQALAADGLVAPEAVADALGVSTNTAADARIETMVRTSTFESLNAARYQFFSDPAMDNFVEALLYSAILDDRTTGVCTHLDGRTYKVDDQVWSTYQPPNHFNCRSLLIPIVEGDAWEQSDPPDVLPQKGFGFKKGE